jgi:glycosyltransferase involved in cell wall biosynthesis
LGTGDDVKRVLVISYFFPPDGGAGTQRAAKFCKYLPDCGWEATVIARDPAAAHLRMVPADAALLSDVGPGTRVVRVAEQANESDWAAALPRIDVGYAWLEPAVAAAKTEIAQRRAEVVLITMSPFSLAFVGQRLQRETGIPVVYDLRDPWALDGWRLHGTRRRWRRDLGVMRSTLTTADGVIANTPEAAQAMVDAFPTLSPERVAVISNGYDAEDFAPPAPALPDPRSAPQFRLVHTGTLHTDCLYMYRGLLGWAKRLRHHRPEPIQTSGRTPLHLLKAIGILRARGDPCGESIRVRLVGGDDPQTRRCVRESTVAHCVELTGYVSHPESVRQIRAADALFLPLHGLPRGRRSLIVPGKTYEYLATGRPILGCLAPGYARDLVERSGRGFCADPCDAPGIARALRRLCDCWRSGRLQASADTAFLASCERRFLTGQLAAFLSRLAAVDAPTPDTPEAAPLEALVRGSAGVRNA